MDIKIKLKELIEHCESISKFDKYFWLSKLDTFEEETLHRMYKNILRSEKELLSIQVKSINEIKLLIENSYPELKDKYLADIDPIIDDFKAVDNEIDHEQLLWIKNELSKHIKNK